ncbi:hypothetical protein ACIBF1_20425 [Spirillospora sp. NPDC050679]
MGFFSTLWSGIIAAFAALFTCMTFHEAIVEKKRLSPVGWIAAPVALVAAALTVVGVIGLLNLPEKTVVDRDEAIECTAEIMKVEDVIERKTSGKGGVGSTRVYHQLRIRVHDAGRPAYETGSTAELSGEEEIVLSSDLKSGHPRYRCWADPEDHERVQILWHAPLE